LGHSLGLLNSNRKKKIMKFTFFYALLIALTFQMTRASEHTILIPRRPDPPLLIDGRLADWEAVPGLRRLDANNLVFKKEGLREKADFAAQVQLAWRPEGLYLGVEVVDDVFSNGGAGVDMFLGDHIELFIDISPDVEPGRELFAAGQFHFAFSPGDLNDQRQPGSFGRCDPEAYRYFPNPQSLPNVNVAALKSAAGWSIEVLLPWTELGLEHVDEGTKLALEVVVSDTDELKNRQERMLTLSKEEWRFRQRTRLLPATLADTRGNPRNASNKTVKKEIAPSLVLQHRQSSELRFDYSNPANEEQIPALFFRGLIEAQKNDGDTFAVNVFVNQKKIDGHRLLRKTAEMASVDGGRVPIYSGEYGFRLPYASSYEEANLSLAEGNRYARFASKEARSDFYLDLSGLLEEGENTLSFVHSVATVKLPVRLSEISLCFMPKSSAKKILVQPAEEFFTPNLPSSSLSFQQKKDALIELKLGETSFLCESYFSLPGGKWVSASNPYFDFKREVKRVGSSVLIIEDTFENLSKENLALMQRHEVSLPEHMAEFYLCGVPRSAGLRGYYSGLGNWSSFAGGAMGGIGLLPMDEVFRIHAENYLAGTTKIGLCDRVLALPPGAVHRSSWALIGCASGSYWDFINQARDLVDANFKLLGPMAFLPTYPPHGSWPDEKVKTFFELKDVNLAVISNGFRIKYNEKPVPWVFNQGMALYEDFELYKSTSERWRRLKPEIKRLPYYHCYIDSSDYSQQRFADSMIQGADGKQIDYGLDYYPLYYPTLENSFGQASDKLIDDILDLNVDGLYWDEFAFSATAYNYGGTWDRVSADIDMRTHKIIRTKSSIALISLPWRLKQAKKILSRGHLHCNGAIYCDALRKLHIPTFAETGQSIFCARMQLGSPIVLGDHLTEATQEDAYENMLNALDYGCVYYWYSHKVYPQYHTITEHMFPITPIRLGPGFIIGKERILTKSSGYFGWGGNDEFEVYVYDQNGRLLPEFPVPVIVTDEGKFAQLDLKNKYSAVIVRKNL